METLLRILYSHFTGYLNTCQKDSITMGLKNSVKMGKFPMGSLDYYQFSSEGPSKEQNKTATYINSEVVSSKL